MGTVFDVLPSHQLRHQSSDLSGIGLFAPLDGCLAGNGVEHFVEYRVFVQLFALHQILGKLRKAGLRVLFVNIRRNGTNHQRISPEVLQSKAQGIHGIAVCQQYRHFLP